MKTRCRRIISLTLVVILILSLSITTFADSYSDKIDEYKKAWDRAKKAGDKEGMKKANEAANKLREQYGQPTSSDGSTDNKYNKAKIEKLKNTNKDAYEKLSKELAEGRITKVVVEVNNR